MDKVALITGGSGGIGKEISKRLAKDGYNLAINYNGSYDRAMEVKKICEEYNVRVFLNYQVKSVLI